MTNNQTKTNSKKIVRRELKELQTLSLEEMQLITGGRFKLPVNGIQNLPLISRDGGSVAVYVDGVRVDSVRY